MIDINEVIYGLEFTKAMITFNPSTGEDVEPENLNEDNKITYNACVGAITLLKEQNKLIAEAHNEGYNEAYRSYCVEVAEEDQELRRILPYSVVQCEDCEYADTAYFTDEGEMLYDCNKTECCKQRLVK